MSRLHSQATDPPGCCRPPIRQTVPNRYRILLTRGIEGTFIYCEDEETRALLQQLVSKASEPVG
jgi:Uncharacterized conserved protein (DUF2075)